MNNVIIMGRLTRDPELSKTKNGTSVVKFSVALDNGKDEQGQKRPATFVDCTGWKGTADFIAKWFRKGKMIAVEGRLTQDTWEKDGKKHSKLYVTTTQVHFTGDAASGEKKADEVWGTPAPDVDFSELPPASQQVPGVPF